MLDFLKRTTVEVKVGAESSNIYAVENGTPQGSVCGPVLFSILINDIFDLVGENIGKSLYVDDRAL